MEIGPQDSFAWGDPRIRDGDELVFLFILLQSMKHTSYAQCRGKGEKLKSLQDADTSTGMFMCKFQGGGGRPKEKTSPT